MICRKCGNIASDNDILCSYCGEILPRKDTSNIRGGAQAIRQGKRARLEIQKKEIEAIEKEIRRKRRSGASHALVPENRSASSEATTENDSEDKNATARVKDDRVPDNGTYERGYRHVYSDQDLDDEAAARYIANHQNSRNRKIHMVNWMKVGLIMIVVFILLIIGGYVYLKKTDNGQKILARIGKEANSTALWAVGEEKLDNGDIPGAIADFEKAKLLDELNDVVDVDGLLLLGNAYEADGRTKDAAALYEEIYTETPSRTEAYINHIRILLSSTENGDNAKAADLMKTAYDKTGDSSFATQRSDFIPAPPEVDLTAGYYETKKYIAITSYQGYDVYYTFDENAELPAGGVLFTERVFLDEGIHSLRAVAVNGELVSDELKGTYKIIMPSPQTPRANLAPNTYKNRQKVKLKPGLDNENDDDIVIYYTIDGSEPDADSPIFTGDAFWLPSGRVTLKAVAVNRYGKVSNTLSILYKIEAKPYPLSAITTDDEPNDIKLFTTTMTEFQKRYGAGNGYTSVYLDGIETECRKYSYDWGYAVMTLNRKNWVVVELYFKNKTFKGPRGTGTGDSLNFVISKFKDMGQVESPSGNRGLYETSDGSGKLWKQEDGSYILRYTINTADSHEWQLDYIIGTDQIVHSMDFLYIP